LGFVNDGLTRAGLNVPAEIARDLKADVERLVRQSLEMAAEAVRLQRLFDEAALPAMFLKGASLAALAYGNLGLRESKDIDVLIPPATFGRATALIEHAGYQRYEPPTEIGGAELRQIMPLRRDFSYVHATSGRQLELHWQLFLNPHIMDEVTVMPMSRLVPLSRGAYLRTLGAEDLFVYLCVHGALHWWYQLRWLADVSALLETAPAASAEGFYRAAKARGAGRPVAQALLLCRDLLHTTLPEALTIELGNSPYVRWLQGTALTAMTAGNEVRRPLDERFGTTRGSLSAFLLGDSWRYRLIELRNLFTNQTDVLAFPLPKQLWFLYPLLRIPLWLWRHSRRHIPAERAHIS
jgi:hypothetical protein